MDIRIPDPFPWPDDELCVEFGRTSYYAHKLEREFKLFLMASHILGTIQIPFDTTKHPTVEAYLYSQTLGGLICILKQGGGLTDRRLKHDLYSARNARNILAHTALENHDPMRYRMADRKALIARLADLRFRIGVPFLVIREFRKVCEEQIGFTEEQLQARFMTGEHDEDDA